MSFFSFYNLKTPKVWTLRFSLKTKPRFKTKFHSRDSRAKAYWRLRTAVSMAAIRSLTTTSLLSVSILSSGDLTAYNSSLYLVSLCSGFTSRSASFSRPHAFCDSHHCTPRFQAHTHTLLYAFRRSTYINLFHTSHLFYFTVKYSQSFLTLYGTAIVLVSSNNQSYLSFNFGFPEPSVLEFRTGQDRRTNVQTDRQTGCNT